MKELLLRTLTGLLLIFLVMGAIILGPLYFLAILVLIFGLGTRELLSLYDTRITAPVLLQVVSAGALLPLTYLLHTRTLSPVWLLIPMAGWIFGYLWSGFRIWGLLLFLWLTIPLTLFYSLGWTEDPAGYRHLVPLSVLILVWINDTFAYVAGRILGSRPMTPRLSPGKTWEGFFGGVVFTLAGGWIIWRISGSFTPVLWLVIAFLSAILGFAGDLFESGLKRRKNIKNMSGLLPGHGGVLDRFDSLLFVAVVIFVMFTFTGLLS